MEHSVIKNVSAILRLRGNPFYLLLVILFVFSACSDKIESGADNEHLLQRKSVAARAMSPTEFPWQEYAETDQVYSHRTSNCDDYGVPEMDYVTEKNQEDDDSMLKGPQRLVRLNRVALWGRKIFYVNYKNSCPDIEEAKTQMHEWERATDNYIRFVERKDNGWTRHCWWTGWRYIVRLTSTSNPNIGGSSTVGCVPWAEIEFSPNAWSRTYLHELGHTLGLLHEMQRYDRDLYIVVDCENIKDGYAHNFKKKSSIGAIAYDSFDYESIMMYHSYAFAKDTDRPTMTKIDGSEIGISTVLSEGDIQNIKLLYHH